MASGSNNRTEPHPVLVQVLGYKYKKLWHSVEVGAASSAQPQPEIMVNFTPKCQFDERLVFDKRKGHWEGVQLGVTMGYNNNWRKGECVTLKLDGMTDDDQYSRSW
ncbi:hypothetical protein DFH94DRAFT_847281 [Russula ochroleuca]|uniref:Uncharacterized protein n=1 Tax=Russula ochroleuca TaxID=152965 RepID=A0A9P5MMQ8_9AGAM|nr:hypothetical protein DFH94DRAFT_847281 [Russula ochroleuca]